MAVAIIGSKRHYQTFFPATENPISESSKWTGGGTVGLDWKNGLTANGHFIGQQAGSGSYDDTVSCLKAPWGADQGVETIVYTANQNQDCNKEIEIGLRNTTIANSIKRYEFNANTSSQHPYFEIVKWNGALGDFTSIVHNTSIPVITNKDMFKAQIIGSTGYVYVNGVLVIERLLTTDINGNAISVIPSGVPDLGAFLHNLGDTGNNADFGFSFAHFYEL